MYVNEINCTAEALEEKKRLLLLYNNLFIINLHARVV